MLKKVVILAGGLGTRLSEETEQRPKPMVEIGGRPILWHIQGHAPRFERTGFAGLVAVYSQCGKFGLAMGHGYGRAE
jgi:GTP:adenosylcobinamide-phosphate guanylyltransferase